MRILKYLSDTRNVWNSARILKHTCEQLYCVQLSLHLFAICNTPDLRAAFRMFYSHYTYAMYG